jgi:signal peptidase I
VRRSPVTHFPMKRLLVTAPTLVAGLVLIGAVWLLFAPAQLGGATRYAVVEGASMEPGLSRGDLVLVRGGRDPEVGDAVLYRDGVLGVRVLHRVIAKTEGRLVLKGDANDFVDDARPRPSEVVGSYWFSIPRAGSLLLWLQQPLHAALLAFGLTIIALAGGGAARSPSKEAPSG